VNSRDVVHQTIDGEAVIIHLARGYYYSLDAVGADVWATIGRGGDLSALTAALKARHGPSATDVETAVADFVDALRREDLIVEDASPASTTAPALDTASSDNRAVFEPPVLHKYTDLQDLLLLDPIHQVDEGGWPEPSTGSVPGNRP
jgi:hypothetical protein